jgi:pimeloyl-ACP methyl ester carboxylesterase
MGTRSKVSNAELDAYVDLLFGEDEARAFLKIMKSFEPTPEKSLLYQRVASSNRYPQQVVWGEKDPALTYSFHGKIAERLSSTTAERLPAKHFLQEDQYDAIAEAIQRIAS